jgi:pterin-4a-carbinolamine dehydratase
MLQGLDLLHRVGDVAEAEGHHPDLHLEVRQQRQHVATTLKSTNSKQWAE